jgi:hypothetical protein
MTAELDRVGLRVMVGLALEYGYIRATVRIGIRIRINKMSRHLKDLAITEKLHFC